MPSYSIERRRQVAGLGFVLPAVLFFAVFSIFPIAFGFYLSLTKFDLLSPPRYVGFDNFRALLSDRLFLKALANTLVFVLGSTVPVWVFSLGSALLFRRAFRGRDFLKALFFLPVLPPLVVVAIVWKIFLHPQGLLSSIIGPLVGRTEINWLTDIGIAPYAMIIVTNWTLIPFFMMIWLAGLVGIPQELREAAHIDGAGPLAAFFHIELPLLRNTAVLVVSLSTITAFQAFIVQYVLSPDKGGPADSTLTLGLLVWKYGFQYFRMGDAAAISVVLFAIILGITAIQLWLGRSNVRN